MREGRLFVITGPSGVGKGTLIRTLLERVPHLELSVSATTRKPRLGETHGVDYHFLDDAEFDRRVAAGAWSRVAWAASLHLIGGSTTHRARIRLDLKLR